MMVCGVFFSLCLSSGSCLVQKTTWFIFGTFRQKRLYRNYKDTQVWKRIFVFVDGISLMSACKEGLA